jgi:hypothetical protein
MEILGSPKHAVDGMAMAELARANLSDTHAIG